MFVSYRIKCMMYTKRMLLVLMIIPVYFYTQRMLLVDMIMMQFLFMAIVMMFIFLLYRGEIYNVFRKRGR